MKKLLQLSSLTLTIVFCSIDKSTAQFNIEFEKTFGDTDEVYKGFCARQTPEGGYVEIGTLYFPHVPGEIGLRPRSSVIIKTDSAGNELWRKDSADIPLLDLAETKSIKVTHDSGFIITGGWGYGMPDVLLLKTDKNGNHQWSKNIDSLDGYDSPLGFSWESGSEVIQAYDGGYIVTGETSFPDLLLLKTDSVGNVQWVTLDTINLAGRGRALIEAEDNTILVLGSRSDHDWYLAKYDPNGNKIWGRAYNWTRYLDGYDVKITPEGQYLILVYGQQQTVPIVNINIPQATLLIKTDTAGNVLWQKEFIDFEGRDMDISHTNNYVITGYAQDSINAVAGVWLMATDSSGTTLFDTIYAGYSQSSSIQTTADSGYIVSGTNANSIYLLKIQGNDKVTTLDNTSALINKNLCIYPNPSFDHIYIRSDVKENIALYIYDITGQHFGEFIIASGTEGLSISVSNFEKGLYFFILKDKFNSIIATNKIQIN
ncbi:MAG: T9SS type A sorting domain-containing protein [Bacteroidia bacterium]|nr:T9SS type A sorting domain-containing protein [Bacteroidia bacterium]